MHVEDGQQLVGKDVRDKDGDRLGLVSAIHVDVDSEEVLLLQVTADADLEAVVPATTARFDAAGGAIVLPYTATKVHHGPVLRSGATMSIGEAAAVFDYYDAGAVDLRGTSLTERITGLGDVSATHRSVRPLPPIVVTRPSLGPADGAVAAVGDDQ
ncbi:PRC-barrel domain-containing protein [Dactylosporangium sp. NPDC049742]|uniref:PRC-barrel domain-containing protein n=1 Tax=Dactylosporangium sp. NPDC049742 TaxID=3154737 RepID=UPI0034180ECE